MATLAMPSTSLNANSPVPLDTIPVSPPNGISEDSERRNGDSHGVVTVFDDADHFNVKHPLANTWTLWFTKPTTGRGDNWNDLLKEVITFDSVEEFWGIYNNITATSELPLKADYHLFKQGVRPEWEDVQNKHGGKWAHTTKERKGVPIDDLWLHVLLAAIGETLEDDNDDEVMGVVVNVRKGFFRLGLWTRTCGKNFTLQGKTKSAEQSKESLMRIGKRFKEALGVTEPVEFTGHTESASAGSTRAKAKLVV